MWNGSHDMDQHTPKRLALLVNLAPVWIIGILGLWLVVIRPLGPHLSLVPGDLGDARFNNYLLEHFYRWVLGFDKSYWNATFFFPFQNTIAFSDNLLGSAPFYALFRSTSLDRETAFQAWYIFGYIFNYGAAAYVLNQVKLKPLAVAVAACFFTFGLPVLAQENHVQLLYRFGIPAACYCLWIFYQNPKLKSLTWLVIWTAWQLFAGIYIGAFLILMLAVMAVLLPFFYPLPASTAASKANRILLQLLFAWPSKFQRAWSNATRVEKVAYPLFIGILAGGLGMLLWPYFRVTRSYGFYRGWGEVTTMLPRWRSYLFADSSQIWRPVSALFTGVTPRWEHQLYPGGIILALALVGGLFRFQSGHRRWAFANLLTVAILVGSTLYIRGFSFYRFIWALPGMKSIRAVTRIELVIMWPMAFFCAYVIDALIRKDRLWIKVILILAAGFLLAESVFYNHATYSKADAQARIARLHAQLPTVIPKDPILLIDRPQTEPFYAPEIDGMLLAQELGWPTLNGYSGNFPPGFHPADSCSVLPNRIKSYMDFARIADPSFYINLIKRVVPIGFTDCNPAWWNAEPH